MNLLAIETATESCSVALRVNQEIIQRTRSEPRAHGRLLLPWIDELLAEAGIGYTDLDAVAVDRGPGGFTSLRIGLGVAQGIALAHDLPVHPVSSLAAIAANGRDPSGPARVLAAFDARMGEVYVGWFDFERECPIARGREVVCAPQAVPVEPGPAQAAGNAFLIHADALPRELVARLGPIHADASPDGPVIARLAGFVEPVSADRLEPVYLRDNVAHESPKRGG